MIAAPNLLTWIWWDRCRQGPRRGLLYLWLARREAEAQARACDTLVWWLWRQTWNQYVIRLIHEVVNPLSDLYIEAPLIDWKSYKRSSIWWSCDRADQNKGEKAWRGHCVRIRWRIAPFRVQRPDMAEMHRGFQMNTTIQVASCYTRDGESIQRVLGTSGICANQGEKLQPVDDSGRSRDVCSENELRWWYWYYSKISVRDICWVTAGSINLKTAGREGEGVGQP